MTLQVSHSCILWTFHDASPNDEAKPLKCTYYKVYFNEILVIAYKTYIEKYNNSGSTANLCLTNNLRGTYNTPDLKKKKCILLLINNYYDTKNYYE